MQPNVHMQFEQHVNINSCLMTEHPHISQRGLTEICVSNLMIQDSEMKKKNTLKQQWYSTN